MSIAQQVTHRARPGSTVKMGLLDSGVGASEQRYVLAAMDCCFAAQGQGNAVQGQGSAACPSDKLGHGTQLARVILEGAPGVGLCVARIFDRRLIASAEQATTGLEWLVEQGVQVVNMSFGLRRNDPRLAKACSTALASGVVLVASAPATGALVYPASYPGVISVTGDVRCQPGEHSWQPSRQADFGACVRTNSEQVVGASVATAYVSALVARYLQECPGASAAEVVQRMRDSASYQRPQRPFRCVPLTHRLTWSGGFS